MSNIIDSIQLSGSSYDVRDKSATTVVEITQSDYDNLPSSAKTSNILYIITDGSVDYITSGQCQTQINNSISGKQDTLSAGTNITISGNVISAEGGSDINVVQTTGTSTTDVMSQNAVTTRLGAKLDVVTVEPKSPTSNYTQLNLYSQKGTGGGQSLFTYVKTINGKSITSQNNDNLEGFSLVETSAITTSITSSSTDAQVPSAKCVYDTLGGLKLVKLTQTQYDNLQTKDNNTLYVIVN